MEEYNPRDENVLLRVFNENDSVPVWNHPSKTIVPVHSWANHQAISDGRMFYQVDIQQMATLTVWKHWHNKGTLRDTQYPDWTKDTS